MSVESPLAVRSPLPSLAAHPQPDQAVDSSFETRWAAWIERGRQHDLRLRRKVRIALLGAVVIGILAALFFGLAAGAR